MFFLTKSLASGMIVEKSPGANKATTQTFRERNSKTVFNKRKQTATKDPLTMGKPM